MEKNIICNNEVKTVIIAKPKAAPEFGEIKKNSMLSKIKEEDILKQIHHFTKPEIFWDNDEELIDLWGDSIEEGTPNVLVYIYTPQTAYTVKYSTVPLQAEIHDYSNIKDVYKAMGIADTFNKPMDNVDKLHIAAALTKKDYIWCLSEFCRETKVPKSVSEEYYKVRIPMSKITAFGCGIDVEDEVAVEARSPELVKELYQTIYQILGKKAAHSKYCIRAVNRLSKQHDMEIIIEAIKAIPFETARYAEVAGCGDKEDCYYNEIFLIIQKPQQQNEAIAA